MKLELEVLKLNNSKLIRSLEITEKSIQDLEVDVSEREERLLSESVKFRNEAFDLKNEKHNLEKVKVVIFL